MDREEVRASGQHRFSRARNHLLGSAAGWNQAHTHLDQPEICLSCYLDAIAVQRDLATAPEREAGGRDDDRNRGIPQCHRRLLERPDHQVELVPVLFLRFEQHEHQVRAGGEVQPLVADDQRGEVAFRLANACLQHLDRVAADRVHLRVELDGSTRRRQGQRGSHPGSSSRPSSDPSPHEESAGPSLRAALRRREAGCDRFRGVRARSPVSRWPADRDRRRERLRSRDRFQSRQQSRMDPTPIRIPIASRDPRHLGSRRSRVSRWRRRPGPAPASSEETGQPCPCR